MRRVSSCLQNIADVEVLNQNQKHLRNRNECFELGKPLGQYVRTTGIHPIRTGKNCARETGLLRTDISTFKAQDKKIDSENIDALISFGCSSLHCGYFSIGWRYPRSDSCFQTAETPFSGGPILIRCVSEKSICNGSLLHTSEQWPLTSAGRTSR